MYMTSSPAARFLSSISSSKLKTYSLSKPRAANSSSSTSRPAIGPPTTCPFLIGTDEQQPQPCSTSNGKRSGDEAFADEGPPTDSVRRRLQPMMDVQEGV